MSAPIAPPKRNSLATVSAALSRAKDQAAKVKDQATMVAREVVTTGEAVAAAGLAGFANEKWGEVDLETGVRIHKTSGVPSSLGAGALLKVGAALGAFGDFQRDAFAFSTGLLADYGSQQGRMAAMKFSKRQEGRAQEIAAAAAPAQMSAAPAAPAAEHVKQAAHAGASK